MSNKAKTTSRSEDDQLALVPKRRFLDFRDGPGWEERQLGDFLSESRLPGSKGNVAKKITVKLWGNGVFEKNESVQGSINTQYFRRKSGQFIYSKLDFLNQAFGVIPPSLDNLESTVDLPCFDIADELNSVFLLEYVKRKDFYEKLGETADGSRKARRKTRLSTAFKALGKRAVTSSLTTEVGEPLETEESEQIEVEVMQGDTLYFNAFIRSTRRCSPLCPLLPPRLQLSQHHERLNYLHH